MSETGWGETGTPPLLEPTMCVWGIPNAQPHRHVNATSLPVYRMDKTSGENVALAVWVMEVTGTRVWLLFCREKILGYSCRM